MIQYLAWRVLTHLHTKITLSFLVVGHTKLSPDWCFGLFKRLYRRTKVGSLLGIAEVVEKSAVCNCPKIVTCEDGSTKVPIYDWTSFFALHMRKVPGIKKLHHLRFESTKPGEVFVKEHCDTAEYQVSLLKTHWSPSSSTLPEINPPKGLSTERQWYLYDQIREFCPDSDKDITCPKPDVAKPTSRAATPTADPDLFTAEPSDAHCPPLKRKHTCRIRKAAGHTSRTCPNNT